MNVDYDALKHGRSTPDQAGAAVARRDQDLVDDFEKAKGTK
jgi:hypothetical protein